MYHNGQFEKGGGDLVRFQIYSILFIFGTEVSHNQLTSIRNLNAFHHVLCNEILHEILKKSNKLHPQNIHEVPVMNFCVATTIPNTKGISFN